MICLRPSGEVRVGLFYDVSSLDGVLESIKQHFRPLRVPREISETVIEHFERNEVNLERPSDTPGENVAIDDEELAKKFVSACIRSLPGTQIYLPVHMSRFVNGNDVPFNVAEIAKRLIEGLVPHGYFEVDEYELGRAIFTRTTFAAD